VGIVETRYVTLAEPPNELELRCGRKLGPITVAYETYGQLNPERDNAILICHALSGDAHVAGYHSPDERKPGWWDIVVGPGKPIDTDRFFVICSNAVGGCRGSTGPGSVDPDTGRPYALDFPRVQVADMVRVQHDLVRDHLGIDRLLNVIGGSMGGMQVLQWAIDYPDMVVSAVPVASSARLSPQAIAFDVVGRHAIYADPNWRGGRYYGGDPPRAGLSVARMVGHITYLSDRSMHEKFGRQRRGELETAGYPMFEVESYLKYKGDSFVDRFDPNSYLYITLAIDDFDLHQEYGSLLKAFENVRAEFLVVSFTGDWLFPTYQSKEIVCALQANGVTASFCEIHSDYGHDAFLVENPPMAQVLGDFLCRVHDRVRRGRLFLK
jgi:homoserine O-acetyltransferase